MGDVVSGTWSGRRVLITGAAGFLGTWTADRLLEAGAAVRGLDNDWASRPPSAGPSREGMESLTGDVRDAAAVSAAVDGCDTVLHLAAQSLVGPAYEDPISTMETNVTGTWVVLEAARAAGVERLVVASSDKAYGDSGGVPYAESMPLAPEHPYESSKACADILARSFARSYDLPVAVIRCGNLYGGGDLHWSRLIPGAIASALAGAAPRLRSDGTPVRDYLSVADAVEGLLRVADAADDGAQGEAFNLAAGQRASVREVIDMIVACIDPMLSPIIQDASIGEIAEQRLDVTKVERELGWTATITLADGIPVTVDWYRDHAELLPPEVARS